LDFTLPNLLHLLRHATSPHDIFGPLADDPHTTLKRRYRELASIAHPDHNPGQPAEAKEAFQSLQHWYEIAQHQIEQRVYGLTEQITVVTAKHRYVGYEPPLSGDLCDLFPVDVDGMGVLLKIARAARNNDLLQAEAQTLRRIDRALDGQAVRAHFPTLVEHFVMSDAAGIQRQGNVLVAETATYSLAEVLRAYPSGIALADAAWMFNRILAALGVAHGLGIVHGAVVPAHVLIRPADHNGILIDWCYSVSAGAPLKAISPPYAADYPPEVRERLPATPATDLYLAARCLLRLLGAGSAAPSTGVVEDLPPSIPKPLRGLLRACLIPSPQRRANDAWQLFDDFREILHRLYGPRTFRPFHMPSVTR
jgi:hypothetical protein